MSSLLTLVARPRAIGPVNTNLQVNAVFLCVIEAVTNRGRNTFMTRDKRAFAWYLLTRLLWAPWPGRDTRQP
jgi:hypothetical protein